MKNFLALTFFIVLLAFGHQSYAQSGAKLMLTGVSLSKDYLNGNSGNFTGWEMRLSARLGARAWYFAPGIAYQNSNIKGSEQRSPFVDTPRLHTLKIPLGLGYKLKFTPFQQVFVNGGIMGSYILVIDQNDLYNFNHLNDVYAGYYVNVGYDLYRFTIDYRYEKSFMNNFSSIEESFTSSHSIGIGLNF